MPIREVGRSGERKNQREKEEKEKYSAGRVATGLKQELGVVDLAAKHGANDLNAMLGAQYNWR
jgi:hypothetical protein